MPVGEVADSPRRGHGFSPIIELTSILDRLDLMGIFGRVAPLHVDLGCGDGSFLVELARRRADANFLGIERLHGRVSSSARRIERAGLSNARVLRMESSYAVEYLLPPGSVETFYLLFPDPWPKRRHQGRRIVGPEFLRAIANALAEQGTLQVATDQRDYFEAINELAAQSGRFEMTEAGWDRNLPPTKFERDFRERGAEIYRGALRKVSPVK